MMNKPPGKWLAVQGLTLVELLSVLTIVVILAGLLVVAVGRVRDSARASKCATNLRTLAIAHSIYRAEHGGYFIPYTPWHGSGETPGGSAQAPWPGVFVNLGYVARGDVFVCPALETDDPKDLFISEDPPYTYVHYGYNYQHLGGSTRYRSQYPHLDSAEATYQPAHENQITRPSRTVLLADSYRPASQPGQSPRGRYIIQDTPGENDRLLHPRHNGAMNVAYVDGRVERIVATDPKDPWAEFGYGTDEDSAFRR